MKASIGINPLDSALGETVRELLKADFDRVVCAVAYAKVGAVARLADELELHKKRKIEAFCSKDCKITSAQAVQMLTELGVSVYLLGSSRQKYHPKFWLAWSTSSPEFKAIVGSGNFTVGGLWINIEATTVVEGDRRQKEDAFFYETLIRHIDALRTHSGNAVAITDIPKLVQDGDLVDESQRPPKNPAG